MACCLAPLSGPNFNLLTNNMEDKTLCVWQSLLQVRLQEQDIVCILFIPPNTFSVLGSNTAASGFVFLITAKQVLVSRLDIYKMSLNLPISGNSLTLIPDWSFTSSMCKFLVSEVALLVNCICTATMLASGLNGCRLKQYPTDRPSPVIRCRSS